MSAALQRDDTCKFTCLVKVETVEGTDREAKTNIIYFCIFTSAFKVILEGICLCHRQVLTCCSSPATDDPYQDLASATSHHLPWDTYACIHTL